MKQGGLCLVVVPLDKESLGTEDINLGTKVEIRFNPSLLDLRGVGGIVLLDTKLFFNISA